MYWCIDTKAKPNTFFLPLLFPSNYMRVGGEDACCSSSLSLLLFPPPAAPLPPPQHPLATRLFPPPRNHHELTLTLLELLLLLGSVGPVLHWCPAANSFLAATAACYHQWTTLSHQHTCVLSPTPWSVAFVRLAYPSPASSSCCYCWQPLPTTTAITTPSLSHHQGCWSYPYECMVLMITNTNIL